MITYVSTNFQMQFAEILSKITDRFDKFPTKFLICYPNEEV